MPASEAALRAIAKWDAENTVQFKMKLNVKNDADILAKLEEVKHQDGGKQGYIKALIRADIER